MQSALGEMAQSEAGRRVLAGETLTRIIGFEADELEAIYHIGFQEFEQGRLEEAGETFRFLCLADHRSPRFWMGLGAVKQRRGDHVGAIAAYSVVADLEPGPEPALRAAECHLALGMVDEALDAIQAALGLARRGGDPDGVIRHAEVLLGIVDQTFAALKAKSNGNGAAAAAAPATGVAS